MLELQRDLARRETVVMDGRDIGTVVLPQAQVKIFLTATPEERARRRLAEYQAKGIAADYETLLKETNQRDENDRSRAAAPLRQAKDAIVLDSTGRDAGQVLAEMKRIVKEKLG